MDNNAQKTLELQAKLYHAVKEYYPSLGSLAKKLQDDYSGDKPFVQQEEDRLGLCFLLDYYDDINSDIALIAKNTPRMTDERKLSDQAEKEHRKEVDEATDMITAEDIVEQAVYAANAPECCTEDHAENMLAMLGANIVDEEIYHDEDDCPNTKQAVIDSVNEEYAAYEKEILSGTPESVYRKTYETYVKSSLRDTICEDVEFDGEVYKALHQDKGEILKSMHEDFIGEAYASLESKGDRAEYIEDYCKRYHPEIMNATEMNMGGIQ